MISHKDKIQSKSARQMAKKKWNFLGRTDTVSQVAEHEIEGNMVYFMLKSFYVFNIGCGEETFIIRK